MNAQALPPSASPPSASTASGTRVSKPAALNWANIEGVVSIMSTPCSAMAATNASASVWVCSSTTCTTWPSSSATNGCQAASNANDHACAMRSGRPNRAAAGRSDMVQMIVGVGADRGVGSDDALGFSGCSRGEHHVGGRRDRPRRAGNRRRRRRRSRHR